MHKQIPKGSFFTDSIWNWGAKSFVCTSSCPRLCSWHIQMIDWIYFLPSTKFLWYGVDSKIQIIKLIVLRDWNEYIQYLQSSPTQLNLNSTSIWHHLGVWGLFLYPYKIFFILILSALNHISCFCQNVRTGGKFTVKLNFRVPHSHGTLEMCYYGRISL